MNIYHFCLCQKWPNFCVKIVIFKIHFAKKLFFKSKNLSNFLDTETSLSINIIIWLAHFCPFWNKCNPKKAIFSTKKRRFPLFFTYHEHSEPIRRTLWWSFRPICLVTLDEEKSCPYLHEWKKSAFKNRKMLYFFQIFQWIWSFCI